MRSRHRLWFDQRPGRHRLLAFAALAAAWKKFANITGRNLKIIEKESEQCEAATTNKYSPEV